MKQKIILCLLAVAAILCFDRCSGSREPSFRVYTQPETASLKTGCKAVRSGDEWTVRVSVRNTGTDSAVFKLVLAAEPHLKATQYLYPGINYNGNPFGKNMPQGWEWEGQPWVFAYDRGSIPSCTISENDDEVFALFASDADTASLVSSSSMEKLQDGSFRHLIYWPVIEAPLSYTGKMVLTERYDTYLTLAPGESFEATAIACCGKPRWPGYGFERVFRVAWERLRHEVPARRSIEEVCRLDRLFQDWCRRKDEKGWWYESIIDDMAFRAGYYADGKSPDGYTIVDYTAHPELNRWHTNDVEKFKRLKPGELLYGVGRDLGFAAQSYQMARLSIQYGLDHNKPEDVDFGLKVFRSWIKNRQTPEGVFKGYKPVSKSNRCDASRAGWALSELARLSVLLREHGLPYEEFEQSGARLAANILSQVDTSGNPGTAWSILDGKVVTREGDGGGYVLMGLARWWQFTRDPQIPPMLDKALSYYFKKDLNHFRCAGGAMDCASVDREGAHPFMTTALILYKETGDAKYLDYARKAGWYFLSWLYLQNPVYGPGTDLYDFDWKPCGATIVGAEHSALDEYACVLIPEFFDLSRIDNEPIWKEVAALVWRYSTQGFADEKHHYWHYLDHPVGSKNEAVFPSRWSKYKVGESMRGSINDHLVAWPGTYRLASLLELSPEDFAWLKENTLP
ncbi:MAG: hypothetical protein IJU13_04595 [Bacteroidales bacterium]|nr:hypothetical protein [Bacteroidales bacterium]